MRYFRRPDGWFQHSGENPNKKSEYLWCIGPDYCYALYKCGKIGEAHLTNDIDVVIINELQMMEEHLKNGEWIETDRGGNPIYRVVAPTIFLS